LASAKAVAADSEGGEHGHQYNPPNRKRPYRGCQRWANDVLDGFAERELEVSLQVLGELRTNLEKVRAQRYAAAARVSQFRAAPGRRVCA